MGPMSQEKILSGVRSRVQEAVGEGASLIVGGGDADRPDQGRVYAPTVLDNGRNDMSVAQNEQTGMRIRTIYRRDRYLRASDHVSYLTQGYPAARFTEPNENFDHEHQNVRVEGQTQFGDLIESMYR